MMYSLDIVVGCESFSSSAELWSYLVSDDKNLDRCTVIDAFTGEELMYSDIIGYLSNNVRNSFDFDIGEGSIRYSNSAGLGSRQSRIGITNLVSNFEKAEQWLSKLLQDDRFIQARLYDYEYDYWQNAKDVLQYDSVGKSYEQLPMKSNGLPPPLERKNIDITANPGRVEGREGYLEFVASIMWLGEQFWEIAGSNKEQLLANDSLNITNVGKAVRVMVSDKPFKSADGQEGVIQNELRSLLYS